MPCSPAAATDTCRALAARDAFALLDGALAPDARATIEAHLVRCVSCRAHLTSTTQFLAALRRSSGAHTAPPALRLRARGLLAAWNTSPRRELA